MSLPILLAENVTTVNPGAGKIVIAIVIILALWGRKNDRGGE